MKKVYLEGRASSWELHSLYKELVYLPPEGYEFVVAANKRVSRSQDFINSLNKMVVRYYFTKVPYDYVRPLVYYFYYRLKDGSRSENVDLTYASQHVVFRREPWVVDLEHAGALVAYGKIKAFKKIIEKVLGSDYCKKIIPWTEMSKKTLLSSFDYRGFKEKIEVVNLAVRPKRFHKKFDSDKIKLLFVGTANRVNISDSFAIKGGNEVLKAFETLCKEYRNLELVLRSYVPANVKEKYASFKDIRIIDNIVSWKVLDYEFRTADIFLFPSHSTPGMAILDAMSYELPVVATDVWANRELVDDGRTGFLIKGSGKVRYFDENFVPLWGEPRFMRAIRQVDSRVVEELVEKTSILIENEGLRRSMGKTGRLRIEEGNFSISKRNQKLKKIFDEALEK
jgi:glycosyltransferase involved in cell wall biosynthesis